MTYKTTGYSKQVTSTGREALILRQLCNKNKPQFNCRMWDEWVYRGVCAAERSSTEKKE